MEPYQLKPQYYYSWKCFFLQLFAVFLLCCIDINIAILISLFFDLTIGNCFTIFLIGLIPVTSMTRIILEQNY